MVAPENEPAQPFRLAKHDDLPPDVAKAITEELQKRHANFTIMFAGDQPLETLPPDVQNVIRQLQQTTLRALAEGRCVDCGAQMPNWPPTAPDWQPAPGWSWFTDTQNEDKITAWQCPACDALDQDDADQEDVERN